MLLDLSISGWRTVLKGLCNFIWNIYKQSINTFAVLGSTDLQQDTLSFLNPPVLLMNMLFKEKSGAAWSKIRFYRFPVFKTVCLNCLTFLLNPPLLLLWVVQTAGLFLQAESAGEVMFTQRSATLKTLIDFSLKKKKSNRLTNYEQRKAWEFYDWGNWCLMGFI